MNRLSLFIVDLDMTFMTEVDISFGTLYRDRGASVCVNTFQVITHQK